MSRFTVEVAEAFERDIDDQLHWLETNGRSNWHDRLLDEVDAVAELLRQFPRLGEPDEPPHRRILLKTLPFAVWYSFLPATKRVVLLRLFHFRRYR